MKDVEVYGVRSKEGQFEKLLTKICIDLKINNYEEVINCFLNNRKNNKNNNENLTTF